MMGRQPDAQPKLFYTCLNLEKRIRKDHVLRKIAQIIDFEFIYKQVEDKYGCKGNVSVPPPVILKMMLLLIFYNVRSERELMQTIPERLDWLWFLGYDLDDDIPNHSVLSKARTRWGADAFKYFFECIVFQCAEADLIDGSKMFTDASLVQADASNNSVVNQHSLKRYLNKPSVPMKVSPKKVKPTASISPQQILMPPWCVWGQAVQDYDTRFIGPSTKNAKLSPLLMSVVVKKMRPIF